MLLKTCISLMKPGRGTDSRLTKEGLFSDPVIPRLKLLVYLALATEARVFLVVKMFKAPFKKAQMKRALG